MKWKVELHPVFEKEFYELDKDVQDEIVARGEVLEAFGPQLGRPQVDTLAGSKYANMKELRADGVWRVAFAFDPKRKAILLVAGDKSGGSEKRFYRQLIKTADERFDNHLAELKAKKKTSKKGKDNGKNS